MFYCVNLDPRHQHYYRFLWAEKPTTEPNVYKFLRLTMGTVDSPFLAINTVHYHLDQIAKEHPRLITAAEFVREHLYVDDLLGATDDVKVAINLRKDIQEIFSLMRMQITKWTSNSIELLKSIPIEELSPHETFHKTDGKSSQSIEDSENYTFTGDDDIISKTTKCLGMSWVPKEDIFDYHTYESLSKVDVKSLKMSKRGISSILGRIYDPCGLLQPFILKGKLILQDTWTFKCGKG